jgi:hypothetical protein
VISYQFQGAVPGYLGYRVAGSRSRFDDFSATSRAFVQ